MDNQHRHIVGYRDHSVSTVEQINQVKDAGNALGALLEHLRGADGVDQVWLERGIVDIQKGLMQVIRGIAKPTTFC